MNESTIQDLINLKRSLLSKIASIDQILEFAKLENIDALFDYTDAGCFAKPIVNNFHLFKPTLSYKNKIAQVLKIESRFLHINQIVNIIHSQSAKSSWKEVERGVNSAKSGLLKDGTIVKKTVGTSNQNSFYGSPNWLDENGNIKSEHMYSEGLVKERKRIEI